MRNREPSPTEQYPELALPSDIDLGGLFWIEPARLGTVRDMINSAHLSTMTLGVETRRQEALPIDEVVKPLLLDEHDPLFDEQSRALEVGYMYGSLLTSPHKTDIATGEKDAALPIPVDFVASVVHAKTGLDLGTENDNYNFFMSLREAEVEFTGSDILAYCLAAAQDHMSNLFYDYHKGDAPLAKAQLLHLQSLFYAGALVGAFAYSTGKMPKTPIELARGRRNPVELVSARLEFDHDDNLENAVDYALRSKYHFAPVIAHRQKCLAIMPNGLQFAPNELSMPIFIPGVTDDTVSCLVPIKSVDGLLIEDEKSDGSKSIKLVRDAEGYLDKAGADEGYKIKGVVHKKNRLCLSAYDIAHPHSLAIDQLIRKTFGWKPGAINYCNELQLWQQIGVREPVTRINRLIPAVFVLGVWGQDAVQSSISPSHEFKPGFDTVVSTAFVGLYGLVNYLGRRIDNKRAKTITQFDKILQAKLNTVTPAKAQKT